MSLPVETSRASRRGGAAILIVRVVDLSCGATGAESPRLRRNRTMANTLKGNAVIGQSGGPTSVINQSLVGVVQEVKRAAPHIDRLLGARHGVRGIIDERFVPLKEAPDELLERVAQTP